jgi:hypothetical protein
MSMMARGGIEQSNHRHADFQSGEGDSRGLLINHLRRLAQLRHAQSELGTSLAHRHLRLHRYDFAVLAHIINCRRRITRDAEGP